MLTNIKPQEDFRELTAAELDQVAGAAATITRSDYSYDWGNGYSQESSSQLVSIPSGIVNGVFTNTYTTPYGTQISRGTHHYTPA